MIYGRPRKLSSKPLKTHVSLFWGEYFLSGEQKNIPGTFLLAVSDESLMNSWRVQQKIAE